MRRTARRLLFLAASSAVVLVAAGSAAAGHRTATAGIWQGTWNTNWGAMTIVQHGTTVTGSYTHDQGKLVAHAVGNKITGTWSEYPTYKGPTDAGPFTLTLAASGHSFTGHWRYANSTNWVGTWHGTFVPATALTWTGTWSSPDSGTMTLTQVGNHVTGSYVHDEGKIDATVSGLTLTGTWSEAPSYKGPTDAGPFVLTLSPTGTSFTGLWAYAGQTPSSSWSGSRIQT